MSEEEPSGPNVLVIIKGEASFENAEEALECLVQLKEADFGGIFNQRETELDSEDSEGIAIHFSNDEKFNNLNLTTDPENNLMVSLILAEDNYEDADSVMNTLLDYVSPLNISEIRLIKTYSRPFAGLDLPLQEDSELDVTGIRIKHEGVDYIIQEYEDDYVRVTAQNKVDIEAEEKVEEDFVLRDEAKTDKLLSEVI